MTTMEPEAVLDTRAAARRLGLSSSYLEKLRLGSEGPRFLKIGRAVRYRAADLELWLGAHARGASREQ